MRYRVKLLIGWKNAKVFIEESKKVKDRSKNKHTLYQEFRNN